MRDELLELLKQLVKTREEDWSQGNYGRRELTAKEQEAVDVGRALIKLIERW